MGGSTQLVYTAVPEKPVLYTHRGWNTLCVQELELLGKKNDVNTSGLR